MAKKEISLLQLVLSLTLITLVAAVALAAVYIVTKVPIEQVQSAKKTDAIAKVLPHFEGTTTRIAMMPEEGKDSVILYMAYNDSELFGAAVETYTDKAFSGRFSIMVGFDKEGVITGTEILQANETPGLGDKIDKNKSDFSLQFVGKNPQNYSLIVKKDGGDVDAITAATISSRAFCDAVSRAYQTYLKAKEENHE
ncbi:MAG: RnfABCDGE type electron transport complex subunit G [Bacteroidales bacterium]|jgi:electron transport complex protein RnfG|nr:RnfABCDGE type electron transport complex subunit G [Bacteroidales bacterium]